MLLTFQHCSFPVLCIALASLVGCGGSGVEMAPVEGVVTLNGKPLEKLMVEFWPESEGPRSFAETDANGRFKLMTDDGKQEGAAVGSHKVVLKDFSIFNDQARGRDAANVDLSEGRKPRISVKYSNVESTMLSQKVESGKNNDLTLEVEKFKQ